MKRGNGILLLGCFLASAVGAGTATLGVMTWMSERALLGEAGLVRLEDGLARSWEELGAIRQQMDEHPVYGERIEPIPAVGRRQSEVEAHLRAEEARRQSAAEEAARRAAEAARHGLDNVPKGESGVVANMRQGQEAAKSFINLVRRGVEAEWITPSGGQGATAEVAVRLGPSGELFGASITRSSGDSAFDRSAVVAVEAASPFPELRQLPANLQRDYRQFNLRFTPGDVR